MLHVMDIYISIIIIIRLRSNGYLHDAKYSTTGKSLLNVMTFLKLNTVNENDIAKPCFFKRPSWRVLGA